MFNKYKPKTKLKTVFVDDIHNSKQQYFLENFCYAERRLQLLKLATDTDPKRNDYDIPEIYDLFKVHDRSYEAQRAIGCNELPCFWDEGLHRHIRNVEINSYDSLFDFIKGLSPYAIIEDDDIILFQDMILKICWFMLNFKDAYERISKLDWFGSNVHNNYILEIIPEKNKSEAEEILYEEPCEEVYTLMNNHVLDNYIRNKEVSEYFKGVMLDAFDMICIIDRAYVDFEKKIDTLKWMEKQLCIPEDASDRYKDWTHDQFFDTYLDERTEKHVYLSSCCRDGIQILRKIYDGIHNVLYGNNENILFLLKEENSRSCHRYEREGYDFDSSGCPTKLFKTMDDLMEWTKDYYEPEDKEGLRFNIEVYSTRLSRPGRILDCFLEFINGELVIYRVYLNTDRYKTIVTNELVCTELGITKSMLDFWEYTLYGYGDFTGYKLPYEYGTFLKIKTPMMDEPDYGRYYPDMDGNHTWYNWLGYPSIDAFSNCTNIAYHTFDSAPEYAVWDWIEKVDTVPEDY